MHLQNYQIKLSGSTPSYIIPEYIILTDSLSRSKYAVVTVPSSDHFKTYFPPSTHGALRLRNTGVDSGHTLESLLREGGVIRGRMGILLLLGIIDPLAKVG